MTGVSVGIHYVALHVMVVMVVMVVMEVLWEDKGANEELKL